MDPALVPPDDFDDLVRSAMDRLPEQALELVSQVAVIVREEPEPDEVEPGTTLLGLFRGIPQTAAGGRVPGSLPDVITLFRRPILAACASREEVPDRVLTVLGHEVGHAFGIGEAELRSLGWA